jgi:hypothetical protein
MPMFLPDYAREVLLWRTTDLYREGRLRVHAKSTNRLAVPDEMPNLTKYLKLF